MSSAHDTLAALRDAGARDFAGTALALDLTPVRRRVRRHRVMRTAVTSVAGVAVVGAGAYGVKVWDPTSGATLAPASSAPAESTPADTPSATPSESVTEVPITASDVVIQGERIEDTIDRIAWTHDVPVERAREALVAALPPEAGGEPEGWVSPGDFPIGSTVEETAQVLVDVQLQNLQSMGVAPEDWQSTLTVASILVKEARTAQEWPALSRMIANRLDAGMRLELESPLVYITRADEQTVTDDGFALDSPFNTFMYEGLPPTPIGAVGLDAVDAAAHPSEGDQLYFVRNEAGALLFAETFHDFQLLLVELGHLAPEDVLPE